MMKRMKCKLIEEAALLSESHPSKDCRAFAKSVLEFFDLEKHETLRSLGGGVIDKSVKGRLIPGVKINWE